MGISNTEWKLSKHAIKIVKRATKGDPYVNELVIRCEEAIKNKDYDEYRKNMDEIKGYFAKLTGKTMKEIDSSFKQGFMNFKKRFGR